MTNNFNTIKTKARSEKIILVRLNPGRQVIDDLVLSSSTTYTMTFNYPISGIKVDGTAYTLNNATALSSGEYSFDESTGLLTIFLSDVVANLTAVVVYYYLFYTNGVNRQTYEDPEDPTTAIRNWEGRIIGYPEFEITQEDIVEGIFTIGNTTLNLINDDSDFQKYLTDNDSFSKKKVKIWQCLNKLENIQKFFIGFVNSISIGSEVTISMDNAFSALDKDFTPFGSHIKSIFNITDYPNVHPSYLDKPIPVIYSEISKTTSIVSSLSAAGSVQTEHVLTDGHKLINISYNETKSPSNNLVWAACKASTVNSDLTETISDVVEKARNSLYEVTIVNSNKYRPGDNLRIDNVGGFSVWGLVSSTRILVYNSIGSAMSNGQTIFRPKIPYVQLTTSTLAYNLAYSRDYLVSTDVNGIYIITLQPGFETTFVLGGIQPNATIYYRVYNHDNLNHGDIVKEILTNAGLSINQDSIDTSNLTNIQTKFSIPYFGSDTFIKNTELLQSLLTSTFGYLTLNNNFEISYNLINTISNTTDINEYEIIEKSITQEIKYSDIISTLYFENTYGENIENHIDLNSIDFIKSGTSPSITNRKTTYLHEVTKSKTISFITKDMDNSKNRISDILNNRRLMISLTTKGKNFSSILGDEFIIISKKLIGILGTKNIKIFSINKSATETKIKGLDLLGL